jgi:hypothetical protein
MARPPLTASFVITMYFVRHRVLLQMVFKELYDFWQACFFTDKRSFRVNIFNTTRGSWDMFDLSILSE